MTRRPPRRAPCLTRHHQVTMRASFQRVGPGQAWIATSRRGWVIAAWVLGCRARFTDSSVKTTRDSLLGPSPGRAPRSALHLDDSGYLAVLSTPIRTQWKGPSASRKSGSWGSSFDARDVPTGCYRQDQIAVLELSGLRPIGRSPSVRFPPGAAETVGFGGRLGVRFPPGARKRPGLGAAGHTFPTTGAQKRVSVANSGSGPAADSPDRLVHRLEVARSVIHRFRRTRRIQA